MKKTGKSIVSMLCVLCLMFSMAACGSAPATGSNNQAEGSKSGTSSGEQSAGGKSELKVGVVCPLTGTAGDGAYIKAACELATKEINDAGGIGGKMKIKLFVEDDEGTPAKSVTVVQKLVNQDAVDIVVGAQNSSCTLANMVITQQAEIPQITPGSSSPLVTQQGNKWIFRTSISDLTAVETILKYGNAKGWKKVALVHEAGDFGMNAANAISSRVGAYGMELAINEQFNSDDVDFSTILTKVQSSQPDAIICWGYYAAASHICMQLKQNKIDIPFIGYGYNAPQFTEVGSKWVEGVMVATGFTELSSETNELVEPFVKAFRNYYNGKTPTQVGAQAYDTMYLIKKAVESIGVENVTNTALRDAIAATKYRGVTGEMSFDKYGDVVKDCALVSFDANGDQHLVDWF